VELTGLRTPCVLIDRFQAGLKRQVLSSAEPDPPFKCGVLGVVRAAGAVAAGDCARARLPSSSFRALRLCRTLQETFALARSRASRRRFAAFAPPPGSATQRSNLRRSDYRSRSLLDQGRLDRFGRNGATGESIAANLPEPLRRDLPSKIFDAT
jgi:hypothetical protein